MMGESSESNERAAALFAFSLILAAILLASLFCVPEAAAQPVQYSITASASPSVQDFGGYVNITGNSTGAASMYVRIEWPGGALDNISRLKGAANGTFYYGWTYPTLGRYNYSIWANYSDGNWSASSMKYFQIIDRAPPSTPSGLSIDTPIQSNRPKFSWSASADIETGVKGYAYSVDSLPKNSTSANFTASTSITLMKIPDGWHMFYVKALDYSGNWGNFSSLGFLIDTPPDVMIIKPAPDEVIEISTYGNYTIVADARDVIGIHRVEFYVDDILIGTEYGHTLQPATSYTAAWHINESANLNPTIKVIAYDESNNTDARRVAVKILKVSASDREKLLQFVMRYIGDVENMKTATFLAVEGGKEVSANVSGIPPLKRISFVLNETHTGVMLGIATFSDKPSLVTAPASGIIYKYFAVVIMEPGKLETIPVVSMNVTFSVDKEWAFRENVDEEKMWVSNLKSWDAYTWGGVKFTEIESHDNQSVTYISGSGETWMFAISGKERGIAALFALWLGTIPIQYFIWGAALVAVVGAGTFSYRKVQSWLAEKRRALLITRKKAILAKPFAAGAKLPSNEFYVEGVSVEKGKKLIVERASFSFTAGKIIAVLGPSGCGKSTLLKAIIGENDYSGAISVFGFDVKRDLPEVKKILGYVPQDLQLYGNMTVKENAEYFANQYGISKKDANRNAFRICRVLNIEDKMNTKVDVLSGGEQKRASIATALVHNPQVLILDEPTSGLDPLTRRTLWRFMKKLNMELSISIITTTHFTDEADYADMVLILSRGKIVAYDAPERLKQSLPGNGKAVEVELFSTSDYTMSRIKSLEGDLKAKGLIEKTDYTGYHVKFFTDKPQIHASRILEIFNSADIAFRTINVVDVSVEDVFVYYTGEKFKVKEA